MGRPLQFEINSGHPLAQGLVFAGLGRFSGTNHYHDSSLYASYHRLYLMEPESDWVWASELDRYAISCDGSSEYAERDSSILRGYPFSVVAWVKSASATVNQVIWSLGTSASSDNHQYISLQGVLANDPVRVFSQDSSDSGGAVSTSGYTVNKWHHVCGVFGSTTSRTVYLDA